MKWSWMVWSMAGLLTLAGGSVWAADTGPAPVPRAVGPNCGPTHYLPPPGCPSQAPAQPGQPGEPPATAPAEPFAQAPEAGTQAAETYNPNMFGDLIGPFGTQRIQTGRTRLVRVPFPGGSFSLVRVPVILEVREPLADRGTFKIADNESPRPVDRVFINYNFFDNVFGSLNPGLPRTDLHRETIGFEKTFLDRNASFGVRLPFIQLAGSDRVDDSLVGDLTFILKYAAINDPQTGNVLSGGLALTAPTGETNVAHLHTVLFQPWAGYIYNAGDFYAHGFTSLVVPTDSRDVTVWFNDLGIGWWLYRTGSSAPLLSAVVPTAEVHVNTPLNHRGSDSTPVGFLDSVNLTFGVNWVLRQRLYFGTAVAFPVTGPQPFDVEALGSLNFRF